MSLIRPQSLHFVGAPELPDSATAGGMPGLAFEEVLLPTPGGEDELRAVARRCSEGDGGVWLRSANPETLAAAARSAVGAGLSASRVVLECPPGAVAGLAAEGWLVAVCPDELGAEPGGPLEAVITAAVADGAAAIRSVHRTEARRSVHVASALQIEKQGDPP